MINIFNPKSKDQQQKVYETKYTNSIIMEDLSIGGSDDFPSKEISIHYNGQLNEEYINIITKTCLTLNICALTSFKDYCLKHITDSIDIYISDNYVWVEVDIIKPYRNPFFGKGFVNTKAIRTLVRNLSGVTRKDITVHFQE